MYLLTAWATLAALLVYCWTFFNVGHARARFSIAAPSCDGPPEFLSVLRVQANTVEQLVLFLPLLWLCAYYWADRWAAAAGALWVVGRVLYALGYYQDPKKRSTGFLLSTVANAFLLAGTTVKLLLFSF